MSSKRGIAPIVAWLSCRVQTSALFSLNLRSVIMFVPSVESTRPLTRHLD
jgi:hypothetical protein